MSIVDFSIRRPVSVFIFTVAAVVFGAVSLGELATDLLPDITYPSLTVRTIYDGAAPLEVESLITRPIENSVGVVNGVVRVVSSSRADVSEVTLEFAWGTNMDLAGLDVRERLDTLRLPVGAERPVLLRFDPSLDPIVRVGLHGEGDLIHLRLLAEEDVKRALERIEGVAAAVVSGGLEEEVQVELDERKLANLGLEVERVATRLAQENVNLTGGRLQEGQSEYLVRTVNELLRAEDIDHVVLSADGAVVRLDDVARVVRGHRERQVITRIDGDESVEVAIYKEGGTNTVTVSDAVGDELDKLRGRLHEIDPGLELTLVTDQARFIRQAVGEVRGTALEGAALAVLILFLFLRSWKATSIIAVSIPVSVVGTFFLMYGWGVSLNVMSLGGLTLGIGMLVDNSIVVLEAIERRREQGLDAVAAALAGASEVSRAVTGSTVTTICVFVPIVFIDGVAGQLFADQALTVTFSLSLSLVVALTLVPMLASRQWRAVAPDPVEEPATVAFAIAVGVGRALGAVVRAVALVVNGILALPARLFGWLYERFASSYGRWLDTALAHPVVTVLIATALMAGSATLAPGLGRELVPELIQGEFFVNLELPPGTHLAVTDRQVARVEQAAMAIDSVATTYAIVGTSTARGGVAGELRENVAQLSLSLGGAVSRAAEDAAMAALRVSLDRQDGLEYRFGRPSYFSFRTPIEVELHGYNLELLKRYGDQLVQALRRIPGLADVESSTEGGNPELQIRFDRERLAMLGLDPTSVAATVRTKVMGLVATDIQQEDRTIDIRLRSRLSFRDSLGDLEQLAIAQRGKTAITLGAVATIERVEGPAEIRRADNERVAVITANLVGRDLASASADIEAAIAAMGLPLGYRAEVGGQRKEMQTSFDSMRGALLLAVFLVYLVMASEFESLLHPLVILLCVPLSLVGVLIVLYTLDVTVSVVVLIGVIMLSGIVVNNAIILIDYTNQLREAGMAKLEALREAGRVRLRPILMTTATTVLGLLPMALGLGEGAELRTPMALTVIGGLTASTALTLLVIPAVYSLVDRGR